MITTNKQQLTQQQKNLQAERSQQSQSLQARKKQRHQQTKKPSQKPLSEKKALRKLRRQYRDVVLRKADTDVREHVTKLERENDALREYVNSLRDTLQSLIVNGLMLVGAGVMLLCKWLISIGVM